MRTLDHAGLILADYQGRIFRDSVEELNCSSLVFLRRFKNSKFLEHLDMNLDYLETFMTSDVFESIKDQYGESEYGDNKYDKDAMYWLGYLYRYISYTREIPTKTIMKLLPPDILVERHHLYYLEDIEDNINDILNYLSLKPTIFDKEDRINNILKSQY